MVTGQFALGAAVLLPLLLGVALMAGDRLGKPVSHLTAWIISAVGSAVALAGALAAGVARASLDHPWVPQIGMRLKLTVDGISGPLIVLAAAVTLLAVGISWKQRPKGTPGLFYGSLLTVLGGAIAAFAAGDALLFFIAFETVLVPMWVLIDRFGDSERYPRTAGWMFLLYTVLGSMFMLLGILVLVISTGTADLFALSHGAAASLPFGLKLTAAVLLTVGLAVKVPLIGVHTWLPRAHTAAPTAGSMLLAAVLLKLGTYGFIRLVVFPLPAAWRDIAPVVAVFAVAGVIIGGLVCLVERDLKRLIAWSSIAHMGFVMLALASGQQLGVQAALYGNLAHGVIAALLFAVVGVLKSRRGQVDVDAEVVGLRNSDPRLGLALVIGCAASMGLPGLAGFWGEVLSMFSAWSAPHRPHRVFMILAVLAAFGAVLAAAYGLRVLRAVWQGEAPVDPVLGSGATPASVAGEHTAERQGEATAQLGGLELCVIALLSMAVVVLGLIPSLVMHISAHDIASALGALA